MRKVLALLLVVTLALSLCGPALAEAPLILQHMGQLQLYMYNPAPFAFDPSASGEATLVVFPTGETLLIDAATEFAGEDVVRWLKGLGLEGKIDCFMATSHKANHVGGFRYVAEAFAIGRVVGANWSPEYSLAASKSDYGKALTAFSLTEESLRQGDVLTFGDAHVDVLWPEPAGDLTTDEQLQMIDAGTYLLALGNHSLVCRLRYGEFSALFTGDISRETSFELPWSYPEGELESDLFKVPCHGSITDPAATYLLEEVIPYVTVTMTCSIEPAARKILDNYGGLDNYDTSQDGAFFLVTDGETMTYWTESTDPVTAEAGC